MPRHASGSIENLRSQVEQKLGAHMESLSGKYQQYGLHPDDCRPVHHTIYELQFQVYHLYFECVSGNWRR